MIMKTGLLLLQSIASSALRSGRGPPAASSTSRALRSRCSAAAGRGTGGAAFLAATVAGAGVWGSSNNNNHHAGNKNGASSAAAMCSADGERDAATAANTPAAAAAAAAAALSGVATADAASAAAWANGKKSIDEPDKNPEHNPLIPFPESSLRHDTYNGVTLDLTTILSSSSAPTKTSMTAEAFNVMLAESLGIWTEERRKGIWIKLPTSHSHLIAPATELGFDFQHAEPGYCVLTKWLPKGGVSRLPNGPTHQVGIGALVIHPRTGKMLAVQERTGPAAARKLWKMPTGLTDPGEDIAAAAVRELKEETGLDCAFDRIICFRQSHGGLFNRSDMFFVCLCTLAPKYEEGLRDGRDIELLPQEEEILMADWMDMEEYSKQGLWTESPLYREMNGAMLRAARRGVEYSSPPSGAGSGDDLNGDDDNVDDKSHGFVAKNLPVGFRPGNNTIYVSSKL